MRACEKRPVPLGILEDAVRDIEMMLHNSLDKEVPSYRIGELAMEKLRAIDEVAMCDLRPYIVSLKISIRL